MHLKILLPLMTLVYGLHAQQNHTGSRKIDLVLKIAWMEKPPYTLSFSKSNGSKPSGLLGQTVWHFIELGCDRFNIRIEPIEVHSVATLTRLVKEGEVQVGLPIFMNIFEGNEEYKETLSIKVLDHPGLEFITAGRRLGTTGLVIKAVVSALPMLLITMLLTAIAGVIVWALVR